MLRPLPFVAMRQQHHQTIGAQPFGFAAGDELIDQDLRTIGKIAKLAFPQHQAFGIGHRKPVFEAEHAIFRQGGIVHFELAVRQGVQWHIFALAFLVDPYRVALAEGAAP